MTHAEFNTAGYPLLEGVLLGRDQYQRLEQNSCSDEVLTVQKGSPTIASDPRLIPQDRASIAGITAGGTTQATITLTLWGPDNATCDASDALHPALYSEEQDVNGTGTQTFTTTNSGDPLRHSSGLPTDVCER